MSKRVVCEFSGWIELCDSTRMLNVQDNSVITVAKWKNLNKIQRAGYILESFSSAYSVAIDGENTDLQLIVEEE